jgi:hypothetical protein
LIRRRKGSSYKVVGEEVGGGRLEEINFGVHLASSFAFDLLIDEAT